MKTLMLNINDEKNCIELLDFSDRSVVLDRCAIIDNKEGMFEFALLAFDIDVDECNVMKSVNDEFYNPESYWFFNGQDVASSGKYNLMAKLIGYNF